ncbi:MAG: GTPase domain-containing protein [Comamonadaceae bacterium]|nr:GTPase domain-containing protein [Comamonadaceae bacterium]
MAQDVIAIAPAAQVQLCLISHTNIGKTTLLRTLLGQDVGDIRDAAHVTDSADAHVLVRTPEGDTLTLWDTPGFGDSVRLHQRLQQQSNPIGWFLSNLWDRWRDKPFWMSQHALRAARDSADVVLYLVNAAERPDDVGYLDAEMHLLRWLGKPAIVLLNQLGAPQTIAQQDADLRLWSAALARYAPMVQGVLALDAFTRSWIHEQRLLHIVQRLLPAAKQPGYQRLVAAWEAANQQRFADSMQHIAALLAEAAQARQPVAQASGAALPWRGISKILQPGAAPAPNAAEQQAMQQLLLQVQRQEQHCHEALLQLHRLDGRAGQSIREQLSHHFSVQQPLDTRRMGLWGALGSGAAGGLGADLATGGLSMGMGAALGALAGAAAFAGAALGLNKLRARTEHQVTLSQEFLDALLHGSLLQYLAIAHFGRGRGLFTETQTPAHWSDALAQQLQPRLPALHTLWQRLRADEAGDAPPTANSSHSPAPALHDAQAALQACISEIAMDTLQALYPPPVQQRIRR